MSAQQIILRRFENGQESNKFVDTIYHLDDIPRLRSELAYLGRMSEIQFVSGNKDKVRELQDSLNLANIKLLCDTPAECLALPEIQGDDALCIAQDKCERAFNELNKRPYSDNQSKPAIVTLVDDTSLNMDALGGMPGPYVKWFLKAAGSEGLTRMVAGFEDKSACAVCLYALMPSSGLLLFFRGIARGQIVEPRGSQGWGWDPVFEEARSRMTFAEMDASTKSKFSHRAGAVELLRKFLDDGCGEGAGGDHRRCESTQRAGGGCGGVESDQEN